MAGNYFDRATLLITHYNRSKSLEHLLKTCVKQDLHFEDIIVSDDCSKPEHLERVKHLQHVYNFRLITSPVNRGLGNNINKGQDAVNTPYTLYVQEDFEPTPNFCTNFINAVKLMDDESKWDIIRFYTFPWDPFPYIKNYKFGYAEILFKPQLWHLNHLKFRLYSDHPHLRRADFFKKFGRYQEGQRGDPTEYDMCLRFIKRGGKALIFTGKELFLHENEALEPNTMLRNKWKLNNSAFIRLARTFYLKGKIVHSTFKLLNMK